MNYRYEMFKYQEIQSTADKMDVGNNETSKLASSIRP
jgi:hypothetical protein